MPIPGKIQELSSTVPFVKMMIIAPPSWGKTVFAGTADRALFLTTDPEGTVSAKVSGSTAKEWVIPDWDEINEAYRYLRDGGHKDFNWVIIDNITQAQRMAQRSSMEISRKMSRDPAKLDEYVLSQADYQRSQNMLDQMVLKFCDLPMNVMFTSHIVDSLEDDEGDTYYQAAIHGQKGALANMIMGYMTVIGMGQLLTKDGTDVRRLWFSHRNKFRGKDRFDALVPYKDNLTVPRMMEIIGKATPAASAAPKTPAAARRKGTRRPASAATR